MNLLEQHKKQKNNMSNKKTEQDDVPKRNVNEAFEKMDINNNKKLENEDDEKINEDVTLVEETKTEDNNFDIMFKSSANKHKMEGTHSLKRDTIFKGKIVEDELSEYDLYSTTNQDYDIDNYNLERGSSYESETRNYEEYNYKKNLTIDIYTILEKKTDINFRDNRRKPKKEVFNVYFCMCVDELNTKYTKSEIFVELAYYFTDHIFNMFKLLDKKNATSIILELKNKGFLTDIGNINFI